MNEPKTSYILRGLDTNGNERFYTGKAGKGWVSDQRGASFGYISHHIATEKAKLFNSRVALTGIWFIVQTYDIRETEVKRLTCIECGHVANVGHESVNWACGKCELIQPVDPAMLREAIIRKLSRQALINTGKDAESGFRGMETADLISYYRMVA
jgi:ribosomal protein S27AE